MEKNAGNQTKMDTKEFIRWVEIWVGVNVHEVFLVFQRQPISQPIGTTRAQISSIVVCMKGFADLF